jgi:hydrogenase maturation protein HypF
MSTTRRVTIAGRVQGVGFRPFVYRLAHELALTGWVYNAAGVVEVEIQGPDSALDAFVEQVISRAPPLARPTLTDSHPVDDADHPAFVIRPSQSDAEPEIHVPPDQFMCDDCLAEVSDPNERRYRYPFINCTQCGPRYTIIRAMPYDRPNTTLRDFPLCPDCNGEYSNPLDRRFHAQPLACGVCGPELRLVENGRTLTGNDEVLAAAIEHIRQGRILAVRGVGGYHLICDAANAHAVDSLRTRKRRPHKPLAVMVPMRGPDGLDGARELADLDPDIAASLADPQRPIVLAPIRPDAALAPGIAPGLGEVGLMLPYSPIHHLLLNGLDGPIVATSGNLSGEPVLTDPDDVEARLANVADVFVHHNRPIQRPADDPVCRYIAGRVRPLRLGRGNAPLELELPLAMDEPTLAVGAFLKNTVALAWKRRVVVSPHIGELDSPRAVEVFRQVVTDLQDLYGVQARQLVCDAHPDFPNSRYARDSHLPYRRVFHHEAHASAIAGEFGRVDEDMLVFAWDGVGFGRDGSLWGGETYFGRPGQWQRVASLQPFRLPGGDRVTRQPWRTGLSLSWHAGFDWAGAPDVDPLLRRAWESGLASPWTSAAGRLFDGAAALTGTAMEASYEGQGPAWLEAFSASGNVCDYPRLELRHDKNGLLRADWSALMAWMADDVVPAADRAAGFHQAMIDGLVEQARGLAREYPFSHIGLGGGVFQNAVLGSGVVKSLSEAGFETCLPEILPVNDAAISYGQIIERAAGGGVGPA